MSCVNIYGFHKKLKKHKIYHILNSIVFGKKLTCHFCIHDIKPDTDPNLNVVSITFGKKKEAEKAINLVNGSIFFDFASKTELHLSAVDVTNQDEDYNYGDNGEQTTRDKEVRQTRWSQGSRDFRDRSRSPHTDADITKIDMEIELIQKERMLIVEQRKLLLEKKRLELLKEFEPTSIHDLERYVAAIERPQEDEQNVSQMPAKVKGTPVPVLASRAIVKQMKDVVANRIKIRGIFAKSLYFTLRKRIVEIMKGKSNLNTEDIIKLYREVYPIESDEVLLDSLKAQIKISKAIKNDNQKEDFTEKAVSGSSNINKTDINKDESNEGSEKQITADILDNELDDWLEDDKVNVQQEEKLEDNSKQEVEENENKVTT